MPLKYRRQRGQLADAMLDAHFHIGGRKLAIGAEPDLLFDLSSMLHEMGAKVTVAVTTTQSPVLERIKTEEVLIGDLEDLENLAKDRGCDLLITHSHGRQAAERLKIPFYRAGFPMFDRLGAGHQLSVGYRGTRDLIFDIANLIIADHEDNRQPTPDTWRIDERRSRWRGSRGFAALTETQRKDDAMKIAFATQDLKRVDAHFGWAKNIAIYEIGPQGHRFLEAVQFDGDLKEDGNEDKLAPKIDAIKDCAILYVAAIGGSGAARVVANNIHPMKVNQPEEITDLLVKLEDVLKGTPPPWLRKALVKDQERVLDFEE